MSFCTCQPLLSLVSINTTFPSSLVSGFYCCSISHDLIQHLGISLENVILYLPTTTAIGEYGYYLPIVTCEWFYLHSISCGLIQCLGIYQSSLSHALPSYDHYLQLIGLFDKSADFSTNFSVHGLPHIDHIWQVCINPYALHVHNLIAMAANDYHTKLFLLLEEPVVPQGLHQVAAGHLKSLTIELIEIWR